MSPCNRADESRPMRWTGIEDQITALIGILFILAALAMDLMP
jgi:hypothetical protein